MNESYTPMEPVCNCLPKDRSRASHQLRAAARAGAGSCARATEATWQLLMFDSGSVCVTGRRLLRQLLQTRPRSNLALGTHVERALARTVDEEAASDVEAGA